MLRRMRPINPSRFGVALPLTLAFLCSSVSLPGCKQVEELMDKASGEESSDEEASEEASGEEKPAEEDAAEGGGGADKVAEAEPEPIPVEPMHTGLDLMLSFVPDDKAQFMIVRDASVLAEYVEEADRFLDGPMQKLEADPPPDPEFKEFIAEYGKAREKSKEVVAALDASGLRLDDGAAFIQTGDGKKVLVFAADDPKSMVEFIRAMGEKVEEDECQPLTDHEGWNICGDKKDVEGYAPSEDPKAVRDLLASRLPGVELDEANILAHIETDKDQILTAALTTLPGLVHGAFAMPEVADKEAEQFFGALQPGEPTALANVQPAAGFVWARTNPEVLAKLAADEMKGAPPQISDLMGKLNGEWMLAGSVKPGGLVFQAGLTDPAAFGPVMEMAMAFKDAVPPEIPDMPEAKLAFEKIAIENEGTSADAMHLGVTGVKEGDILKAFSGLHFDAWAFAAGNALTVALGPDAENVAKLMHTGGSGPSEDTLAGLPAPLAAGLKDGKVSFAMHMPMDFLQGAHMHKLVKAALKNVPDAKPEQILAMTALAAPLSSGSVWFEQHEGAQPVVHLAMQGVGNRTTDEGKDALDAAHAVADGADPAETFGPLAEKYTNSAMAFAYATRAGTEGPGSLVGSGVGAMFAAGMIAAPMAMGVSNETLADDLGVKPEDPEPEVEIKTKPVAPKHEPKPEPKPKAEPKKPAKPKDEPKTDDPKDDPKDDPIVEPDRPKPPVPKPTVDPDEPKKPRKPRTPPNRLPRRPRG